MSETAEPDQMPAGPADGWYPDPDFPDGQERVWRGGAWASTAKAYPGHSLRNPRDSYVGTGTRAPTAESIIRSLGTSSAPAAVQANQETETISDTTQTTPKAKEEVDAGGRATGMPVTTLELSSLIVAQNRTTHAVRAIARMGITLLIGGLIAAVLYAIGAFIASVGETSPRGFADVAGWVILFTLGSGVALLIAVVIAVSQARDELAASERRESAGPF